MALADPKGKAFPTLSNDCILRAARGEKTEFVPVWIMRQAGRYLPEFRELRQKHSFFECCETPSLACEITLMPIRRFNLDAAIIFSDILVIPQALGLKVEMTPEGPKFPAPLKQGEALRSRLNFDVTISKRLHYVYEAITITRHALEGKCPLIGFSGAPWTLMCYMIEGGGSKTMSKAKKWLYQEPLVSVQLLDLIADKVTDHLVEQVRAGAQMVQLFESNAEYLNLDLFRQFAYPQIVKICTQFRKRVNDLAIAQVPIIVFAKGGHYAMDLLAQNVGLIDVISLDWTLDPKKIRTITNNKFCLQGNLDPCALYSDPETIATKTKQMLEQFGTQKYIANLGHGIYPDADFEHVKIFIDLVHKLSRESKI
jgi:uroporphyrinogen decarboxylase